MTRSFSKSELESIASRFCDAGIEPAEQFVAAAGKDYGYVHAWKLDDNGGYVIEYSSDAQEHYAFSCYANDLSGWLLDATLSGLDYIIQTANVLGIDSIDPASEDAEGPFYVIKTRHYYGPIERSEVVLDDYKDEPARFEDYEDAMGWLQDVEDEGYITAQSESGAPTYTIVAVPE
jgi:hypothetical protein